MKNNELKTSKIGKKLLKMHSSHLLPTYYNKHPLYDRALPRIAQKIAEIDGYITCIDIGANIGDTVSLITDRIDGTFLCIEGDQEYIPLLQENTKKIIKSHIYIEDSYCSDKDGKLDSLKVDHKDGTTKLVKRTGVANTTIKTRKLDTIIKSYGSPFIKANLLKVDTDGFEIEIFRGAKNYLKDHSPLIFFEFTPSDYIANGNDPLELMRTLRKSGYHNALFYDNFGYPIANVNLSDEHTINELIRKIDLKSVYYYDILTWKDTDTKKYSLIIQSELLSVLNAVREEKGKIDLDVTISEQCTSTIKKELDFALAKNYTAYRVIANLKNELKTSSTLHKNSQDTLKIGIEKINTDLLKASSQLSQLQKEKEETELALSTTTHELDWIRASKAWKIISLIRNATAKVFPIGSARRKWFIKLLNITFWIFSRLLSLLKTVLRVTRKFHAKIKSVVVPKKVSKLKKKLVYIGHSYHLLSKSTEFLTNYLQQFFEVEILSDYSWQGQAYPDLSFIDESYAAVIFFQNIPEPEVVNAIRNNNKILFPMFDNGTYGRGAEFWRQYNNLRIINFSKATQEIFANIGIPSIHIQYFPKTESFIKGEPLSVFFWQRQTRLNINTLLKLFENQKVKIHIHRAIDPGQTYIAPTQEDIEKYSITFSDWTKYREEMLSVVEKKSIYVAPREFEGLGLSFLEAMAQGKAVIAPNNPTMNEYIIHNKTGYLYSFDAVTKINLENIDEVQKQTFEYMQRGYESWKKDKKRMIKFIMK